MGQQARLRAARRTARRELTAYTRAEHETRMSQPEVIAAMADKAADTEVEQMWQADRDAQALRLYHAGWRLNEEGLDGLGIWDHRKASLRMIHSVTREQDGRVWAHMSVSTRENTLPGWYLLRDVHRLLYPGRTGIIVIPPESEHYSISEIHHVWTCLTAEVLPDFRFLGAI